METLIQDIRYGLRMLLRTEPQPEIYINYLQAPTRTLFLVARTASDPLSLAPALRGQVWAIDPDRPVSRITTMEQVISGAMGQERFSTLMLGIFAGLALILAGAGIYAVVSYSVTQSTREIGIRIALGAQRRDVLKLIVGHAMVLAVVALIVGLVAAVALARVMEGMLYGISATDPLTFTGVSVLAVVVTVLASYVPARKAMNVDPIRALRHQ